MGNSHNHPDRWDARECPYCRKVFHKAPTYATCGHPRCIRQNRAVIKKRSESRRDQTNSHRLPNWTPPDIYSPDHMGRSKIWNMLVALDIENAQKDITPRLIETVAIQAKVKPAEVFEVWRSMRKELKIA